LYTIAEDAAGKFYRKALREREATAVGGPR
jgi:hypothetical protein